MGVMKPYDRTLLSVYTSYDGRGSMSFPVQNSFERHIFNCSSKSGDKKKPNDHSWSKSTYVGKVGYDIQTVYHNGWYPFGYSGKFGSSTQFPAQVSPVPATMQGTLEQQAMAKIYDKIRGKNNLIVDAAESAKTVEMIKNVVHLKKFARDFFVNAVHGWSRTGLSKGQKRLDYLTQKWLEQRYGWLPTIGSIYDALDTIGRKRRDDVYTLRARTRYSDDRSTRTGKGTWNDPTIITRTKTSARMQIICRFNLPANSQIYDWTSLNPVGIAWELMPLSFVVDWLYDVGGCLQQWENYFIFKNRFVDGAMTFTTLQETNRTQYGNDNPVVQKFPNGTIIDGQVSERRWYAQDSMETRTLNRNVLSSLPLPGAPILQVNMNSKRYLDAVALVQQTVVKGFRK